MNNYIEMAVPPGMRIPTMESYASGLLPSEIQDDYCWINQYGCVAATDKDALTVVQIDDCHFSLLPGPEFSPRLYRGQTTFHKKCVPSLFREPMAQIRYLTDILKKYEFYKLMSQHPIIRYLQGWSIDGKYFKIDMDGLSAHYEFATPMMDVTKSKDVAMFFATCKRKDQKDNLYEPIIEEGHEIVLYTVDLKAMLEANHPDFHVIGFQALPRPGAQKAYSLFVGYKENLNVCPFVSHEIFRLNPKESEKYFEMFEGGAKLFPDDPVDNLAREIKQSIEIDSEIVEVCFERHWIPKVWKNTSDLKKFLNKFGYVVTEKHLEFSDDVRQRIIENWNNNPPLRPDMVKCRFVSGCAQTDNGAMV